MLEHDYHNVGGLRHNVFGLEQCKSRYLKKKHVELKQTRSLLPDILWRSALGFSLAANYNLVLKKLYFSATIWRTDQVHWRNDVFD